MNKSIAVFLLLLSGLLSAPGFADDDTGKYLLLGTSRTTIGNYCQSADARCDATGQLFTLGFGYKFNEYVAVQGIYHGNAEGEKVTSDTNDDNLDRTSTEMRRVFDLESTVISAEGLGIWPVTNAFNLYGKLGLYNWNYEEKLVNFVSSGGTSSVASAKAGGNVLGYGIGMEYVFWGRISLGFDISRFKSSKNYRLLQQNQQQKKRFGLEFASASLKIRF